MAVSALVSASPCNSPHSLVLLQPLLVFTACGDSPLVDDPPVTRAIGVCLLSLECFHVRACPACQSIYSSIN